MCINQKQKVSSFHKRKRNYKFKIILSLCRSSHRDCFRKYLFFFSRSNLFIIFQEGPFVPQTDMNFPGGSICSLNRHEFSRRAYRKDMFFQGGSICSSNRSYYLIEQILIFPETLIWSSNTYEFSRGLYFLIEQILIFQEALSSPRTPTIFQETLSSPRTHTIFQETPMPRTHRLFPGRYPLSNRYFANRSRWLLSSLLDLLLYVEFCFLADT